MGYNELQKVKMEVDPTATSFFCNLFFTIMNIYFTEVKPPFQHKL